MSGAGVVLGHFVTKPGLQERKRQARIAARKDITTKYRHVKGLHTMLAAVRLCTAQFARFTRTPKTCLICRQLAPRKPRGDSQNASRHTCTAAPVPTASHKTTGCRSITANHAPPPKWQAHCMEFPPMQPVYGNAATPPAIVASMQASRQEDKDQCMQTHEPPGCWSHGLQQLAGLTFCKLR